MKYILTETQYISLVEKKRDDKIAKQILEELDRNKKNLHEGKILNEAIVDTLKKYAMRGLLTVGVLSTLLANNVSAQDLEQAGVPENQIEIAQQDLQKQVNPQQVERAIVNNLRKGGKVGVLKQFQGLDQQRKTNVVNAIANQLGGDLSKLNKMDISLYLNRATELPGDQFTKIGEEKTISVDTMFVDVVTDYKTEFAFNSAKLENPQAVQQQFQNYLNSFYTVDKITIVASSSTLRNTGDFKDKTWKESSQERVNSIKQLLVGMDYNLGGCGANESNTITEDMIDQNIDGTNGDGTSGPQSPFEIDQRMIDSYTERGIDSAFWKSNAKESPMFTVDQLKDNEGLSKQYEKYQYVKVVVSGQVVLTQTDQIVNLDYLKLEVRKDGGKIKKNPVKGKQQGVKVQACPTK